MWVAGSRGQGVQGPVYLQGWLCTDQVALASYSPKLFSAVPIDLQSEIGDLT